MTNAYPPHFAPSRAATIAACCYLLFLAALPPALGAGIYAALILGASAIYLAPDIARRGSSFFFGEYAVMAALLVIYLLISFGGSLRPSERLFSAEAIPAQSAGVMLMLVCIPALTKVAADLFADRTRLLPLAVLAMICVLAALTWRQDESILNEGQLYGVLAPALFIQFSIFVATITLVRGRAARAIVLAFPLLFLGAASNTIMQLGLIALVLAPRPAWFVRTMAILLCIGLVVAIYGESWLDPLIADDTNSLVRLHLWRKAWPELAEYPLGIGYGAAYLEQSALRDPFIFHVYAGDPASSLSIANHSSLLDLALRLGWAGLIVFALMLRRSLHEASGSHQYLLAAGAISMVLVAGTMNPILESARSALFVAFAIGFARGVAIGVQRRQRRGIELPPLELEIQEDPSERRKALAAQSKWNVSY